MLVKVLKNKWISAERALYRTVLIFIGECHEQCIIPTMDQILEPTGMDKQ